MNHRAIPAGFMAVGEAAKKMGTTVRTLQYYDKEGVLSPSGMSDGGRRLYTDKDVIKLYQIQAMKYLGFSLTDIKERLFRLDTPTEVAAALTGQAGAIREKIAALSEALSAIEQLRDETLKMKTVDWTKYADILVLLQNGAADYTWLVRNWDDQLLKHGWEHFDKESGARIIATWNRLCKQVAKLQKSGTTPTSEQAQLAAKDWWDMVMEFTGGDMGLLPQLSEFAAKSDDWDETWKEKWAAAGPFIQEALDIYFNTMGFHPFK